MSRKVYGFTEVLYSIEDLLEKANARHLGRMQNSAHCFHSVSPNNSQSHNLSLRKEGIYLPYLGVLYNLYKRSFVPRCVLARDVIYTSRAYATMSVSVCLSVCL